MCVCACVPCAFNHILLNDGAVYTVCGGVFAYDKWTCCTLSVSFYLKNDSCVLSQTLPQMCALQNPLEFNSGLQELYAAVSTVRNDQKRKRSGEPSPASADSFSFVPEHVAPEQDQSSVPSGFCLHHTLTSASPLTGHAGCFTVPFARLVLYPQGLGKKPSSLYERPRRLKVNRWDAFLHLYLSGSVMLFRDH